MNNPFTPPPGGSASGSARSSAVPFTNSGGRPVASSANTSASTAPTSTALSVPAFRPASASAPAAAASASIPRGLRLRRPARPSRRRPTRQARRRPRRHPGSAVRSCDARLRDDPGDLRTQRRPVASQPGLGLPDPAAAGRRGPHRRHRKRRQQAAFRADRRRPRRGREGRDAAVGGDRRRRRSPARSTCTPRSAS